MGAILSSLLGTRRDPNEDVPDPVTGITPKEVALVQKCWEVPRANPKGSGVELLVRFFTKFPDHQKHFQAFKDVPISELRENPKLGAHAVNVFYTLTCIIDHLNDSECLIEMLSKVGRNHGHRGITRAEFEDLKGVLMQMLKDLLNISPECEKAFDKTINVAYSVIFKGMESVSSAPVSEK